MADVHDKETRSYNMSPIKGKDRKHIEAFLLTVFNLLISSHFIQRDLKYTGWNSSAVTFTR